MLEFVTIPLMMVGGLAAGFTAGLLIGAAYCCLRGWLNHG